MDIETKTKRLKRIFLITYFILVALAIFYLIYSIIKVNASETTNTTKTFWKASNLNDEEKISLVIKSLIIIAISLPVIIILKFKKRQIRNIISSYLIKIVKQKNYILSLDGNYKMKKKIKEYKKLKSLVMQLNRICGDEIILINSYIAEEIEKITMQIEVAISRNIACDELSNKSSDYNLIILKIDKLIKNYEILFNPLKNNDIE